MTGGGPQLMAKTFSNLTGLEIDHYLYVDLNGFQDVVNTLGGVDLCIPGYNVNTPGLVEGTDADGNPTQIQYDEVGHIVDPNTGLDVVPGVRSSTGSKGSHTCERVICPAMRAPPTLPVSAASSSSCAP